MIWETEHTQSTEHEAQTENRQVASQLFPEKEVELQPRSKAGPSLLFPRGRTPWSLCFWVCGPAAGRGCLPKFSYFCRLACPRFPSVKELFPLGLNPRPRSRSRWQWFVLAPISPRSGDTTVRAFRDPYQLMVIRAPSAPGPSYPRCSPN